MSGVTHGADVARLREISSGLTAQAEKVGSVEERGSAQLHRLLTTWLGPDAEEWQSRWSTARQQLTSASQMLTAFGALAADEADQQEAASGGTAGSGGAIPSTTAPGAPAPANPPTAANLYDELAGMSEQERLDYLSSPEFRDRSLEDPAGTKEAMDRLYDEGLLDADPQLYSDYLQQHWQDEALREAGIDPEQWDPSQGFEGNREIITKVYEYYGQLYMDDPDLKWAAMANMIGPSFAGGFADLGMMRDVAQTIDAAGAHIPPPDGQIISELASLSDEELAFYEESLLSMQQEIFYDQGAMHEAYRDGGIEEIERMHEAGLVDDNAMDAWQDIASGDPERVDEGNHQLLWREQNQIIVDDYQDMQAHQPGGNAVMYGMTLIGEPSVPGARSFPEVFPLEVTMETPGPENIPFTPFDNPTQGEGTVTTPLPDGNIADQSARWALIEEDTWPAFAELSDEEIHEIVSSDFDTRLQENRPSQNVDEIAERILRGFDVDVEQ